MTLRVQSPAVCLGTPLGACLNVDSHGLQSHYDRSKARKRRTDPDEDIDSLSMPSNDMMTGEKKRSPFSTVEETEWMLALIQIYTNMREDGEAESDERLDRIAEIINDGYLTEFLIYELGTRVGPQMMLMQSDDLLSRMEEFVGKYVIVDRE